MAMDPGTRNGMRVWLRLQRVGGMGMGMKGLTLGAQMRMAVKVVLVPCLRRVASCTSGPASECAAQGHLSMWTEPAHRQIPLDSPCD